MDQLKQDSLSFQLQRMRDLVVILTQKELRVRYKSYALGYVWSLMNPLLHATVFYFVFQIVMRADLPNYPVFLISGLFAWQWISNSLSVAPITYIGNAPLIKKVPFPYSMLPLVVSIQDVFHFLISVPVILLLLLWFQIPISPNLIWGIPLLCTLQLLLTFFLGLLISSLNLFFRDLERLVSLGLTILFYGTPIVYAETSLPEKYRWIADWNPAALLIISWRSLFLNGEIQFSRIAHLVLVLLPIGFVSTVVYRSLRWRFSEVL